MAIVSNIEFEVGIRCGNGVGPAMIWLERILERCDPTDPDSFWRRKYSSEYSLAYCHFYDGHPVQVEEYMRAAAATSREFGAKAEVIIECLSILESWLISYGEHDKARAVREEYTQLVPPDGVGLVFTTARDDDKEEPEAT